APAPEKPIPTLRLLPKDVEQDSIRQSPRTTFQDSQVITNCYTVRWTYTGQGAKKVLDFREAHWGEKTRTVIGAFECLLTENVQPNHTQWKEGWIKYRTDSFIA